MSSGRGRERSSQRVARSTERRLESSISLWTSAGDRAVERLDVRPQRAHVEHVARDDA